MFKDLFKKYRLKAEIATLAELGNILHAKGFFFEDSIFSHWQRGSRTPHNRTVLMALLDIFKERQSVTTLGQANEFMESAGQGYLTDTEKLLLDLS